MYYINKYWYGVDRLLPKENREWSQGMTLVECEGKRYCCSHKELLELSRVLDEYGYIYYQLVPIEIRQRLTYLSKYEMDVKEENVVEIKRYGHYQYIYPNIDSYTKNRNHVRELMDKHRVGTFPDIMWPRVEDGFVFHEITGLSKLKNVNAYLIDKNYKVKRSKGEKLIAKELDRLGIVYIEQFCFDDCKDKRKLRFDFYIPSRNTCIEYDGEQHSKPVEIFGGKEGYENTKKRDNIKNKYCKEHNIALIRINHDNVITSSFVLEGLLK
jgi:very-short-patch-repair endonuclease